MNVKNLRERHPGLIAFMKNVGYSKNYVTKVRGEINHILAEADSQGWNSYNDVYRDHTKRSNSAYYLHPKRVILGLIEHFEVYGQYPNRQRQHQLVRYGKYHLLTGEFKAVIDYYCAAEKERGKKDSTIYGNSHNAARILYELQEKGINNLRKITEEAILSVFVSPDGSLQRGYGYKKNISAVFKACIPQNPEVFTRILTFLPALRDSRKNIQYLLPEEISRIKQALSDEHSPLSFRDKTIGILALYTGLRSCDIARLRMDSIDWENDLILINQQKTGFPFELPLTAIVGNAVYDYMTLERPETDCEYIFISYCKPYRRLKACSLKNISAKIMGAAGIRKSVGDCRGFRIFRHHLATELLGNGVAQPIISRILGHASPDSLDKYLSADFRHLKECALSIECFSVSEEVFKNA